MFRLVDVTILLVLGTSVAVLPCLGAEAGGELVLNSRFETGTGASLPDGWTEWRPDWDAAACRVRGVAGGLEVTAPGKPYAVGGVVQRVKDIRPGQAYRITAACELEDTTAPYRAVIVRISWLKNGRR